MQQHPMAGQSGSLFSEQGLLRGPRPTAFCCHCRALLPCYFRLNASQQETAGASAIPTWPFFRALAFCATSSPMQSFAFSTCSQSLLLSRLL